MTKALHIQIFVLAFTCFFISAVAQNKILPGEKYSPPARELVYVSMGLGFNYYQKPALGFTLEVISNDTLTVSAGFYSTYLKSLYPVPSDYVAGWFGLSRPNDYFNSISLAVGRNWRDYQGIFRVRAEAGVAYVSLREVNHYNKKPHSCISSNYDVVRKETETVGVVLGGRFEIPAGTAWGCGFAINVIISKRMVFSFMFQQHIGYVRARKVAFAG